MEIGPGFGVGVSDLQHAMRAEVDRIAKETRGDALAQTRLLHRRLHELGLLQDGEAETLSKLAEISAEVSQGKKTGQEGYFEARDIYNAMLAGVKASPVAMVIASSSVGSYTVSEGGAGSGAIMFAKNNGDWEHRGAAAGALIGSVWGPEGAVIGGAIGGLVGAAVDSCTK